MEMPHQRLEVASVKPASHCRLLIQIRELLYRTVIENRAHEFEFLFKALSDNFVNGPTAAEHSNSSFRSLRQPKSVDSVEALEKPTCCEISVEVDRVVTLVVQADPFTERGRI